MSLYIVYIYIYIYIYIYYTFCLFSVFLRYRGFLNSITFSESGVQNFENNILFFHLFIFMKTLVENVIIQEKQGPVCYSVAARAT